MYSVYAKFWHLLVWGPSIYITDPARTTWKFLLVAPIRVILQSPHPLRLLLHFLRPFPLYLPLPSPLSPASIIANPALVERRMDEAGLPVARHIWPFRLRDTPLRCLYRIYEWASIGRRIQVGYETQYFWAQASWRVEDIPDPKDPDPVRYAVLAAFAEVMPIAFNERIDLGLLRMENDHASSSQAGKLRRSLSPEEFVTFTEAHHEKVPDWALNVRGPSERVVFQKDCDCGGIFTKRNIEICGGGNMCWL